MDNKNEELIFDFLAAAEDTGKRLDEMVKRLPGELRSILTEEWRRSPWLATLPTAVERLNAAVKSTESAAARTESAAERAGSATEHMERRIKTVCFIACLASIIMPLATWGLAYWQTSNLRDEQAAIRAETERLKNLAMALKDEAGGGLAIWKQGNGKYDVALPTGAESDWSGRFQDGRYGFSYTVSPVSQ